MTQIEWNSCIDPQKMLAFLRRSGRATDRKLRLFAVACCRSIWPVLTDPRSRTLMNTTEQFADGVVTREEWDEARRRHTHIYVGGGFAVEAAAYANAWQAAQGTPRRLEQVTMRAGRWGSRCRPEVLLRDSFGPHPFREVAIDPPLLSWNDTTVVKLAQAAYDNRLRPEGTLDNGRLAILADALEEAGCTDAEVLGHLRRPGPHVWGCWVLDPILGKS
jgi:hypothetical protein